VSFEKLFKLVSAKRPILDGGRHSLPATMPAEQLKHAATHVFLAPDGASYVTGEIYAARAAKHGC
jgi:hypothetical protein